MTNEVWKEITFGNGRFSVSNNGRVRNNETDKILSQQIQNSGYKIVHLNYKGKRKANTVHRLVAIAFVDREQNKNLVDHKDGNKLNNHFENLRWVTPSGNMQNAFQLGKMENAKNKAKGRMKKLGSTHGFENSQKNLIKAKPVSLVIEGTTIEFRSLRQASLHLKIDHKTLSQRISKGLYQ